MARFEKVRSVLADFPPILERIGVAMVSQTQANFRTESFGGKKWLPRYSNLPSKFRINIAGAISDANKGQQPKERRLQDRPVLRDTGELFNSIAHRVISDDAVEWGSNLPYAEKHQLGLRSRIPVTDEAKVQLAKFLKKRPEFGPALGRFLKKDVSIYEFKITKRPFIGVTKDDLRVIEQIIKEAFAE